MKQSLEEGRETGFQRQRWRIASLDGLSEQVRAFCTQVAERLDEFGGGIGEASLSVLLPGGLARTHVRENAIHIVPRLEKQPHQLALCHRGSSHGPPIVIGRQQLSWGQVSHHDLRGHLVAALSHRTLHFLRYSGNT